MAKVVTFGEIMVRLGAPGYLKLIQANQFDVSYAGAEANVAVSLANYGLETDYITCLPDNPIAERCIMDLRGHKVGVDHIQRTGKRMGILYLETGSNARPAPMSRNPRCHIGYIRAVHTAHLSHRSPLSARQTRFPATSAAMQRSYVYSSFHL